MILFLFIFYSVFQYFVGNGVPSVPYVKNCFTVRHFLNVYGKKNQYFYTNNLSVLCNMKKVKYILQLHTLLWRTFETFIANFSFRPSLSLLSLSAASLAGSHDNITVCHLPSSKQQ